MMISFNVQIALLTTVLCFASGQDRTIIAKLHPGCLKCTDSDVLVYIKADGANDTIHQIWDFTRGLPTVIYIVASLKSSMVIMWNGSDPSDFLLTETPQYSFAATIDQLIEYDDIADKGYLDRRSPQRSYNLTNHNMAWSMNESILTDTEAMLEVHGQFNDGHKTAVIDVRLDLLPFEAYAVELPHLIHSANSTLVDVRLVNASTSREFNRSRFALRVLLASADSARDAMHCAMRKSLDDEHTPGVFEIIEIQSPRSWLGGAGGFVQFRPVAYTQPERSVSSSTNAHMTNMNKTELPHRSTLAVFFRDMDRADLLVEDMYISFGLSGDGYYRHNNFTSWSFTVGYGRPPAEGFSLFVVIIISVGLGAPVLLALAGVLWLVARRWRQTAAPQRFTDEE